MEKVPSPVHGTVVCISSSVCGHGAVFKVVVFCVKDAYFAGGAKDYLQLLNAAHLHIFITAGPLKGAAQDQEAARMHGFTEPRHIII